MVIRPTVLVIAPEVAGLPKLGQAAELTRIGDSPYIDVPSPLIGSDVTRDRIINRLSNRNYDAVLWAGHGVAGKLFLSDGSHVDPRWLASQLNKAGVGLLILSACQTANRPEERVLALGFSDIIPASGVHLIAMTEEVSDKKAVDYDVALLQALGNGEPLRRAHEIGLEAIGGGSSSHLFMAETNGRTKPARAEIMQDTRIADIAFSIKSQGDKMDQINERLHGVDRRLSAVEVRVENVGQMVHQLSQQYATSEAEISKDLREVRDAQSRILAIEGNLQALRDRQDWQTAQRPMTPMPKEWLIAGTLVGLAVLMLTIIITWRLL